MSGERYLLLSNKTTNHFVGVLPLEVRRLVREGRGMCLERNGQGGPLGCRPSAQPRPSRSPRPHCSRPRVSVACPWARVGSDGPSHDTRMTRHTRAECKPPMCAQATRPGHRHANLTTSLGLSRPTALSSTKGATTSVSGHVETRQQFTCEVHGPAAIRGSRCWHLRARTHSCPSASETYFFSRRELAWVKMELFLQKRAPTPTHF